jgi:hypothetical protein
LVISVPIKEVIERIFVLDQPAEQQNRALDVCGDRGAPVFIPSKKRFVGEAKLQAAMQKKEMSRGL